MKTITSGFINALKGIKQLDVIISYADRENTNFIITQNSELLLTEASDYLVTESAEVIIDNGGVQKCNIYWNTDLLKSTCKMLELEVSNAISKGTELNVRIGVKVGNDFEYVDYGKFYTTEDSAFQMATGTYTTVAYDNMVRFNIVANENPLTFASGTTYTLAQYLQMICNKCGVYYEFDFTNVPNSTASIIDSDPYSNVKSITYRDIIDDIAECMGTNFIINENNKITNKELKTMFTQDDLTRVESILLGIIEPTEEDIKKYDINKDGRITISDETLIQEIINGTKSLFTSNITLDADIIKDTNVYIGEKKDAIDGIQVYDGSTMINYIGTCNSPIKIKNNNIMSAHSSMLLTNTLPMISDFEYYNYQLETFGVFALEPYDCFTTTYNNEDYLLCSFNNDIKITTGAEEDIAYDFKEEDNTIEYTTQKEDIRDAYIEIDKANGQVVLKANANGNIVQAELNANASEGSAFNVKADNINFDGKTFNLTTENVAITSTNFSVDKNGNMYCNNADVSNINVRSGDITIGDTNNNNVKIQMNQNSNGINVESASDYTIYGNNLIHMSGNSNERIWIDGNSDNFNSIYLWSNGDVRTELSADNSSGYLSLYNSSGDLNIVLSGGSGNVRCVSLTQTSLEESKENIKEYTGALKEILSTDIYEYNLKNEDNKNKKHLGFVIGKNRKYSKKIVALDEEGNEVGVDSYSMTSLCLQAIKEQQEQIEELKQEIKALKGEK